MESQNEKIIENFTFQPGSHRDEKVIWIRFEYNTEKIKFLKSIVRAKWSRTEKSWYATDKPSNRKLFGLETLYISDALQSEINPVNIPAYNRFIEQLKLKAYSKNTIRTYAVEFAQLLKILKSFPVQELSSERLRSYLLYCIGTLKLSENTIHSRMNAIKFYFEQVLHREKFFMEIPRPKKPSLLPKALSQIDIKKMFDCTENLKHKLLLQLCYGMGLRVSELVNLKITDIESARMQVLVSQGKGKKDRYVILPDSVLEMMRVYFKEFRPKNYFFEGQKGSQYSVRAAQQVFKDAMRKAKINKKVGIHSLRHSYATHLIEQGTDIRFVQDLLGHNSIKTTMIYTNITDQAKRKIKSPLDNF